MSSRGAFIATNSGGTFYPFAPRIEDIKLEDIAHALSNICRFTGHTKNFYSVAQHSLICAAIVSNDRARPWALMHDATEAYIGDISSPIRRHLFVEGDASGIYQGDHISDAEDAIAELIRQKFNIPYDAEIAAEVHAADKWLGWKEGQLLVPDYPGWLDAAHAARNEAQPFEPSYKYVHYEHAVLAEFPPKRARNEFVFAFSQFKKLFQEAA